MVSPPPAVRFSIQDIAGTICHSAGNADCRKPILSTASPDCCRRSCAGRSCSLLHPLPRARRKAVPANHHPAAQKHHARFHQWPGRVASGRHRRSFVSILLHQSDESGRYEIYLTQFPPPPSGPGGKRRISKAGGILPRWRQDGGEVFYVATGARLTAAEVSIRSVHRIGAVEVGAVRALFGPVSGSYEASADGEDFSVCIQAGEKVPGAANADPELDSRAEEVNLCRQNQATLRT
jgi:hypothetical protein